MERDSAVLNWPNEKPVPVEADHVEICKFTKSEKQRYATVLDSLSSMIEEIIESSVSVKESSCSIDGSQ